MRVLTQRDKARLADEREMRDADERFVKELAEKSSDPLCVELRRQRREAWKIAGFVTLLNVLTLAAWCFVTWLHREGL